MTDFCRLRREWILQHAEGYLELGLPEQALELLQSQDAAQDSGRASYLRGEALRQLARYAEAIPFLERSIRLRSDEIHIYLALAWCYKRTDQLPSAIDALERALAIEPSEAILHYNLACYWCLAHNRGICLQYLARALQIDDDFRELVQDEPDFELLRDDPEFRVLVTSFV